MKYKLLIKAIVSVVILTTAIFILSFIGKPPEKEFAFKFSATQVNQIVTGLQYSRSLSSADANDLIGVIQAQLQVQINDTTNKK